MLFASEVLRRVGIDPFLVLIPHHAFLGFYLEREHKTTNFLETTRMGVVDLDQSAAGDTTDHDFRMACGQSDRARE